MLIESNYGLLKSENEQHAYFLKTFFNIENNYNYLSILQDSLSAKKTMPTFSVDDLLPSMPVPCLAKTCDNYLESVRPFVTDEELKTTTKVVENFKNGVGKDLQVLLVEKAKHERNWVFFVDSVLIIYMF